MSNILDLCDKSSSLLLQVIQTYPCKWNVVINNAEKHDRAQVYSSRVGRISHCIWWQDSKTEQCPLTSVHDFWEKKNTTSHAVEDYKWKHTRVCRYASKVWCSFQSKLHTLPKFSFSWTRNSLWFLSPFMKWPTWSLWTSGTISSSAACLSQGTITVVGESFNVSCSCTPVRILNHKPSPEPLP